MTDSASSPWNQRPLVGLTVILLALLYVVNLTQMGMYSADEPRYADIGRHMAQSGDWITPKLWGQPWFEKPPLLYWMTALGFKLGLSDDYAPRVPIAILSLIFLVFFRSRLIRVFDERSANYATAMLATSAGWLAYSHVAVTDLPLAVFFSAAVLLALPGSDGAPPHRIAAAIALGLAVLTKSLPPLLLFAPILISDYRNWKRWFLSWPILAFLAIALPWHILGTLRNGGNFLRVLIIEQQFGRFFSNALQHEQPWWFYFPVLVLFLYPWFPLALLAGLRLKANPLSGRLAAIVVLGIIFFSASVNKLPGYVLPLVPVICILMGTALARSERPRAWTIAVFALLGALPFAANIISDTVAHSARVAPLSWPSMVVFIALCAGLGWKFATGRRGFILLILLTATLFSNVELKVFPILDRAGSARSLWASGHPECAPVLPRGMLWGLYYYAGKRLPDCAIVDKNAAPFLRPDPTR